MKWIGLTGGIASGKSTVAEMLRTLGHSVLDADLISRQLTGNPGPALDEISRLFGVGVLNPDRSLNRKALGDLVFGRAEEILKLENILHPLIQAKVQEEKLRLAQAGKSVSFYDVPLLYEKKLEKGFDAVVVVAVDEVLQRQRLALRNSLSLSEVEARLKSQMPLSEKVKLTSYVIHNDGDLKQLEAEVQRVLKALGL